jgi:hypothetical protein
MSYRGVIEKLNANVIKRLLMVAAEDVFLSEAAKNSEDPKCIKAREYLTNAEFHSERMALLAMAHDQNLNDDSPDSQLRKAVDDVFDILLK